MDSRFRIMDGTELITALEKKPEGWDGMEVLALVGAWKGHWQGEFQITTAMLEQMRDFGNSRKVGTVVDYGHASIFNSGADAAGWIEPGGFAVKGSRLLGKISWNAKALEKIAANELRYKSPTIVWNTKDRKTGRMGGASLHSVALTNTPFLTELPEVRLNQIMSALSGHFPEDQMNEEQIRRLAELMGMAADARPEQIITAASRWATTRTALTQVLGEGDPVAAVRELQTRATTAEAANARIAELEAKVSTFEAAEKDKAALELVRTYQAQRKIAADDTPNFEACLAHAKTDPEGFTALMESLSPWVAGGEAAQRDGENSSASSELDATQRAVNEKLGISDETFLKYGKGIPQG